MNTPFANQPTQPPLAVVGLSALFPKASNAEEFWSNIRCGVNAITEVPSTHWNPADYFDENQKTPDMTYARRGGFLSPVPFDPLEFGISPNNLEAIDTSQLLGMVGAKRALEHAGYGSGRAFDRSRVGCILGVTGTLEMVIPLGARLGHPRWRAALKDAGVPNDVAEDVVNRISQSYVPWQENSFPGLLGNVVAGRIANRLDLHGTNCVVDAACASSLSAIHLASLELWTGRSDMVVTGGIDTFNDIFMFMCFSKTPALSPSGDAKPFSDEADGTILGEGVGMLVLKRLADAERDGDRIYAVLKGIGTSSDGAGNAVYAPKAEGQIRCLQDAYRVAGVTPDTIELVEAHGTGTKVGDATEVSGLMSVFQSTGRRGAWCAVGSVKSQIGHTKAAAGAAGVIKAILALQHRVLPPTIKVNQPPSAMLTGDSPFYVNTEARPWVKPNGHPRRAAVSAFGFGGSNFHCVLEESPQQFDQPDWDGDVQVLAISAPSVDQLSETIRSTLSSLNTQEWPSVRVATAKSRREFRGDQTHRVLFVIEREKTDLARLATGALTMLERYSDKSNWSTPDGAYYGRGDRSGKLGVLFPGQGSQYVGMLRELACRFPAMSDVLSEANDVFSSETTSNGNLSTSRLSDFIYPHPAFSPETRSGQDAQLRATQIAQPALGAVSLGVLAILERFGVRPEAVAGHSYGELTALCASKRFGPQVLYRLSMLRGQLMAAAQEVDGGMLAVGAPLTQIEAALKELTVDLVVANHNSPTQVVLSGRIVEIDRATSLLAGRNIRGKKLSVAAAFHSPLVAPASLAFRPVLDGVEFRPSTMPVYANSTATEYPTEPHAARDLLATQLARPVHFVREVEQMHADGVRTFLEVGPGGVLTGLVNSILSGQDYRAVAIDSSTGKRSGLYDLASALAQLSAAGYPVRWEQWDPQLDQPAEMGNAQRLRIPICGANYMKPRPPIPPRSSMIAETTPSSMIAETTPSGLVPNPLQPSAAPLDKSSPMKTSLPAATESDRVISLSQTSDAGTLETIRQALAALQRLQEETSRLHQQFLVGQEEAIKTFARLADLQSGDRRQEPLTAQFQSEFAADSREPRSKPPSAGLIPGVEKTSETFQQTKNIPSQTNPIPNVMVPVSPAPAIIPMASANANVIATPMVSAPSTPLVAPPNLSLNGIPKSVEPQSSKELPFTSPLASTVLAVVSEKTGYPIEMLNLEMSLDHDLGIDSIKRVEILSALQERVPNLPAFQPDELGSLHTLRDVVSLADARMLPAPDTKPVQRPVSPVTVESPVQKPKIAPPETVSQLGPVVLAVVSEKTGYPTEMLNLDMSLDHDLGIDSIKRVEILSALQERVPNLPAFQPEELGALHTLRDVVTLADARTATNPSSTSSHAQPSVAPAHTPAASLANPQKTTTALGTSSLPAQLGPIVLAVVSEKTGYPVEMLNLEMSLDHDLGIDSIKRVEILSALQERVPNLPAFQPEELGALHTLRDVVTLSDSRIGIPSQPAIERPAIERPAALPDAPSSLEMLARPSVPIHVKRQFRPEVLNAISRSIVKPVPLAPAASRPSIQLLPGSDVWITDDGMGLSLQIAQECTNRGLRPRIVNIEESQLPTVPAGLGGLIIVAAQQGMSDRQLWCAIEWLQKVGSRLRQTGASSPAIVATVSRLDGRFGFEGTKRLQDPVSGGLAGLAKCAAREWPEVTCRAFDLSPEWTSSHVSAAMLVTELFHEGPVEVGLCSIGPFSLEVVEQSLTGQCDTPPIQPSDVVLISGGARGVTAEAAYAIASAWHPRLVILGRSPEPVPEPEWLASLTTDAEIRQALITRASAGTTPKAISAQLQSVAASREVSHQLQRLRSLGVSVVYHSVDVRDPTAVRPLLARIRNDYGVIRGVIHGAGVLADQRIEDKTREQFDRVYQTKVQGLRTLLEVIDPNELRLLGVFSSYTARFGRVGQLDYAIANEVLNKQARQFAILYPQCRVASFNWGPWDGGMVQGGLKQIFASEGVGLIPLEVGAEAVIREFGQSASRPVEVLVLGKSDSISSPPVLSRPSVMPQSHANNQSSDVARSRPVDRDPTVPSQASSATSGATGNSTDFKVAFERELDVAGSPFLESHVLGGKAVLPVAVILEWLAHGAIHRNAGLELHGIEDFRLYQGVRLGPNEKLKLRVLAGKQTRHEGRYQVAMQLVGHNNGRDVIHAAGTVVLAAEYLAAPVPAMESPLRPYSIAVSAAYATRLFHGAQFRAITSIEGCSEESIQVTSRLAPSASSWMLEPVRANWLADPLAIDAALQAIILWSQEQRGKPCLPCGISKYEQFVRVFPRGSVRIFVRVQPNADQLIHCHVEFVDLQGHLIARMENCESVADASLRTAFQNNTLNFTTE